MCPTVGGSTVHCVFGGVLKEVEGGWYFVGGKDGSLCREVELVVIREAEECFVGSHVVGVWAVRIPR